LQALRWPNLANILDTIAYHAKEHPELLIATAIVAVGFIISAIMLSVDPYSLRYYADGISHLVIARSVFDNLTPGLAQLGGVWLPMSHLLMMPFVANDFLFHTGLAGTIVSISATVITMVALFKILQLQFASSIVAIFGSFLYFLNPSVIYIGIIPMMEALFMMFFMLSVYYAQKWYYLSISEQRIWFQYRTLLKCALAVSAASLTRYEGWALPLGLIFIIPFVRMFILRRKWGKTEKHTLQALFTVVLIFGFMGITSWIAWNLIIFKDPSYFVTGPYSAAAQADIRGYNEQYKLNPVISASLIFDAAEQMYGLPVLAISSLGIGIYLYAGIKRKRLRFHLLTVLMMMIPILVDFGAMIHGSGEIVRIEDSWFNGRYLIFIAPLLAFGSSSLLNSVIEGARRRWKPLIIIITVLLIAGSYAFTFVSQTFELGKAVALNDIGLIHFNEGFQITLETGKQLERLYHEGNVVLLVLSGSSSSLMIESHLPLKSFIDVVNGQYWEVSKQSPWIYGNYVVLQKKITTTKTQGLVDLTTYAQYSYDPLTDLVKYWNMNKQTLLGYYDLIYENDMFEVYKRK
jgi:hypothetical protein